MNDQFASVLLGLDPAREPTLAELNAAWREQRSALHPDRGGDPSRFNDARRAYEYLHARVTRPRTCPECDGLGRVHHQRGFTTLTLPCARCRGTGQIRFQPNGEPHAP